VRDESLIEALTNTNVGVILVDIVIGYSTHGDPAGYLANVLTAHRTENGPVVIASVTGTEEDPQVRSAQVRKLETVGVRVAPTNADAAAWALSAIRNDG
jgi:hypothetical protein